MRRLLLSLAVSSTLALPLSGCGHPMQRTLEGRWLGEAVENFDDQDLARATGWAKGVTMEFAGSTLTVTIPAEDPKSGKYEVLKAHGQDVYLAVLRPTGGKDKVHFKLDDEHSIRWMLSDGRAVVMRREN